MGRTTGAVCRLCRREGTKLFLKGERCDSPKCSFNRRPYPPGERTFRRGKISEYGIRLRAKQRLKRFYLIRERQLKLYFEKATRVRGNTALALLQFLERRLDNVVYLLRFAPSRRAARQLIVHRHIQLNGRIVDRPSYLVEPGDLIRPAAREGSLELVRQSLEQYQTETLPGWLELRVDVPEGAVLTIPTREDISADVEEQLVVEFYSR